MDGFRQKADFQKLAAEFGIDPVTARLIRNRDIVGEEAMREYLYGDLTWLHDPHLLKDMDKSVGILQERSAGEKRSGSSGLRYRRCQRFLYSADRLLRCGALVDVDIPDRIREAMA